MAQPGGVAALGRLAESDGKVLLAHQIGADDLVHVPQRGIILRGHHQTLGAPVQPVAQRGGKGMLLPGNIFAFLGKISGEGIHQIGVAGAVRVAEQVSGLVQHRQILVLVDHLNRRLTAGRCLGRRSSGKELVVDIKLQHIPGMNAVIRVGFFAVYLDAFVPKALVQQAVGQINSNVLHKTGKAHAFLIGARGKAFHSKGSSLSNNL